METRDRIRLIIEQEGLTQVAFSEATGINTSTLNHVLTGRNNPSVEVITKILTAFPQYESEWLLHGQGLMWTDEYRETQAQQASVPLFSSMEPVLDERKQSETGTEGRTTTATKPASASSSTTPTELRERALKGAPKRVEKIIIYYSDQTFETFYPEQER